MTPPIETWQVTAIWQTDNGQWWTTQPTSYDDEHAQTQARLHAHQLTTHDHWGTHPDSQGPHRRRRILIERGHIWPDHQRPHHLTEIETIDLIP